jgi:serine phosphatase RsbU (regulator of sigma subunit)/anti-sigma regulatory factor (Ser/Thr protein kinase)/anti-anti-sigma regulatory factor
MRMPVEQVPGPAGAASDVVACFEAMPAIVWAFEGPQLVVVAANAGARASAGNRPRIVGRPIREVLPELEGQQIFEMMEEAYTAGRVVSAADRRVLVDRDGDGRLEEGFFTYTFVPTSTDDGRPRGLVVHIVETTPQARRALAAEHEAQTSRQRLEHASDVVLELQRSLLAPGVPVLPRLSLAAQYRVAGDELAAGGDWYDTVVLPDGRVALVVGDVVGHGARAAGAMGQLRAVLTDALTEGQAPSDALRRVNRFAARNPAARAASVCLVVVEPDGSASVGTHAHPLPLLVGSDATIHRLATLGSAPLGTSDHDAVWQRVRLEVGDMLLLFTDGLIERADRSPADGMQALVDTLAAARRDAGDDVLDPSTSLPTTPVERVATLVVERMAFFGDGYADDVTVLVAQHRHPVAPLALDLQASASVLRTARAALTRWLDELSADVDDADALVYAAGEALANTVKHAYRGLAAEITRPVRVQAQLSDSGGVIVEIADRGRWQPAAAGSSGGGRGLLMMRELCDTVDIDHPLPAGTTGTGTGVGTTVRLARRLHRPVTIGMPGPQSTRTARAEELVVEVDEDTGQATVAGPIDPNTVDKLRAVLLHATRGGIRALTVDLSAVTVLSSAGVQLLHDLAAIAPGLILTAVPGKAAHHVLQLVGLADRIVRAEQPGTADRERDALWETD